MGVNDGWETSTEGDLDPDLTDEAGYAGWDPPRRSIWPRLYRATAVVLIVSLFVPVVIAVLSR